MEGVIKVVPVPRETPPVITEYQLMTPAEDAAPILTIPGPHLELGAVPVMKGIGKTVADTAVLIAEIHPASLACV